MTSTEKQRRSYWLAGNREPGQDVFFVEALDPALWTPGNADNWDTCWYTGMPNADVFEYLDETRTINHIPGNNGLTIKDFLYETLRAARERQGSAQNVARMGCFPRVYAMPDDYHELQACAAQNPDKKWILKPKNSSRGRGIEVVQDIATIPLEKKWMVQEYIDNPHVMNDRKYVLRLYVLVTSVEPLRFYLHKEGFAKLASEPYNIEDPDNPFAHLTNPDINATNTDADAPVVFVGLSDYRAWLRDEGHDDEVLFAKIHDLVTLSVMAVRERMRKRLLAQKAPANGCYELLGVDCLVDEDLKPWILECNLSPSLAVCAAPEDGGEVETEIKRTMVADMVSLLGLNEPVQDRSSLSKEERIIDDAKGEMARAGGFQLLFPAPETAEDYLSFFPVPRYADLVSARAITGHELKPICLVPNQTTEIVSNDELALYSAVNGTLFTPNPVSGWIWLKVVDGADPEDIASELMASHEAAHGAPNADEQWMIRENVWDALSNWAHIGLLRRAAKGQPLGPPKTNDLQVNTAPDGLLIGNRAVSVDYGCPAVADRLAALFAPLKTGNSPDLSIAVQQAPAGYAMAVGPRLVATGLGLDQTAPMVARALFEQAPASPHDLAIAGALVPISPDEAVLIAAGREHQWDDALAVTLGARLNTGWAGGAILNMEQDQQVRPIGLPVRLDEGDCDAIAAVLGTALSTHRQTWPTGGQGRYLPAASHQAGQSFSLRAVVIPERRKDSDAGLKAVSVHRGLEALLVSAVGAQGRRPDGAQVRSLSEWLAPCGLYTLGFAAPQQGVDMLVKTLDIV